MKEATEDFLQEFDKTLIEINFSMDIEFGNNRFNDGQVCSASSTKDAVRGAYNSVQRNLTDFWSAEQAFNNKDRNTMKWLVCDAGAVLQETESGTGYRCLDIDNVENMELGWWSQNKSNFDTEFTTPEWVKSEFFEDDGETRKGRLVNKFVLYLTEGYNNMRDIGIQYMDVDGTWIDVLDEYTLAPDEYIVTVDRSEVDAVMVYGLKAIIYSTEVPNDHARISELNGLLVETFTQDDIVTADVHELREEYEDSMPIGISGANTFDFELDNTDNRFSANNVESDLAPYLVENVRVVPYIGVGSDRVQMGEYWTDDWSEDGGEMSVTVNCRDFSKFIQETDEDFRRVYLDKPAGLPFVDILTFFGFPAEKMEILANTDRLYPITFIDDQSPWEFFGELGLAERLNFVFDHEGKFVLSNTYIPRNYIYDDFVRDTDGALEETYPTYSQKPVTWTENSEIITDDGLARTVNSATQAGASLPVEQREFDLEVQLLNKGDQAVVLFTGGDGSDGIRAIFNLSDGELSIDRYGVLGAPSPVTYSTQPKLRIHSTEVTFKIYIDDVVAGEVSSTGLSANSLAGFQINAAGDEEAATKVVSFAIKPGTAPVMELSGTENIEVGSTKSEIWTNEVVVKMSEYSTEGHGTKRLWGPDNPTILSYSRLNVGINATATNISVEREVNQENGSLDDNGWPKYDGLLFFPLFSGSVCTGGELVKYKERNNFTFFGCERGYMNTTARSWAANSYIGEAREWDMEFDGKPALSVKFPFVTAIDSLLKLPEEGIAQAYVPIFNVDNFGGKLIVANTAKYLTWLEGNGQTIKDFADKKNDVEIDFSTSVAGVVALGGENSQKVKRKQEDPTQKDKERIRKYGKNKVEIDNKWIQTREHAQEIADTFIEEYSEPRFILDTEVIIPPVLELGDRVRVTEYANMAIVEIDYYVIEISSSYDGGLATSLVLRQA